MRCAIMQPTYLPWAGYFNLMASVDVFVFLDDVQYEQQSWQNRNRILLDGKEHYLTVPIKSVSYKTILADIRLAESKHWKAKHWKTLVSAYRKAPYGDELLDCLYPIFHEESFLHLVPLNQRIILELADRAGLKVKCVSASELECGGHRTEHVITICERLGCDTYLSPLGAREYLDADGFSLKTAINLEFQNYSPANYGQYRSNLFHSHLSFVDVVANQGFKQAGSYAMESL